MNRYAYVTNNPVNLTDPDGMMPMMPDASTSWATISSVWANEFNFGGPETGRSIIAAAEARFDRAVADTIEAKYLNEALRQGKITPDQAEAIVKSNENLAIESTAGVAVTEEVRVQAGAPEATLNEAQHSQPLKAKKQKKPSPPKLTFKTLSGGKNSSSWTIRWKLAKPSKTGGWIIQEITAVDQFGNPVAHYWEAWQVPANSEYTTTYGIFGRDDTFQAPSGERARASARFYEGLTLPAAFIPNNPNTYAGILPSTTGNPNLPMSNASRPVNRRWKSP